MNVNYCEDDQHEWIEMKAIADPTRGFLTAEERIIKKAVEILTSVDFERENNIAKLYLCKFVVVDDELDLEMEEAIPVYFGARIIKWDRSSCPEEPDFVIEEILRPDHDLLKLMKRRRMDTPLNLHYIHHSLVGFFLEEKNFQMAYENRLLIRKIMLAVKAAKKIKIKS